MKIWIITTVFLLTSIINSFPSEVGAITSMPVRSWCGDKNGLAIQCEVGTDGIYRPITIEMLFRKFFGDVEQQARKVVKCESNFDNSAIGKAGEIGVFQIHPVHFKEAKNLGLDLHSLEGNFSYSRILYGKNGWKDWSCAKILKMI